MRENISKKYPELETIKEIYNAICNFLQVAIGSGESEVYAFDIVGFSNVFKFAIHDVYYSIKILESNGNFNFLENNFFPTRLKLAIGSSALYKFQVNHSEVANLITLITRSYPGLFDRFVSINEKEFTKRLNINQKELHRQFGLLEQYGVAEVRLQSSLPQLTVNQRAHRFSKSSNIKRSLSKS